MGITEVVGRALARGMALSRARVIAVRATGAVRVRPDEADEEVTCEALVSPQNPAPVYREGEEVLVALPTSGRARGIVLGRIGTVRRGPVAAPGTNAALPARETGGGGARKERLVLEANEEIVLRVGAASIQITRDGKIVVRGEHVLTRARGTNRIKGGTVAIN